MAREPRYECETRPAPSFRHVIFLVLDALRSDMLASGGDRRNLTPHLDRLAERALVFSNVTAASSYTPASVYAYFTGEHPVARTFRPEQMHMAGPAPVIREAGFDLIAAFAAAGYRTINISGNSYLRGERGLAVSFREEHFIWPDVPENDRSPRTSGMDQEPVMHAIDEMAASADPVMLYLHYLPPHVPYNPPEEFRGFLTGDRASRATRFPSRLSMLYRYGQADAADPQVEEVFDLYRENVRYADALVGEVLDALTRNELLEKTLVLVIADHGEAFFEHGEFKHTSTVYDEMIRVPMLFVHPSLRRGTVSRHVGLIDLPPTLVELCGLPSAGGRFEGRSLWPLMMQEPVAWEDRWYFTVAAAGETQFGYRTDRQKYIYGSMRDQLFDLVADPRERHSVHESSPFLAAWLRQKGHVEIMSGNPPRSVNGDAGLDASTLRNLKNLGYIEE